MITTILFVFALIAFLLATANLAVRINLVALGLVFCALAWLLPALGVHG